MVDKRNYACKGKRDKGEASCWTVPGEPLDTAVEALFLETMVPGELELSLSVEREWNKKLTALTQAQQEYERRRQQDRLQLNEEARARILSLAADVPKLWADPKTPQRERKQVVRFVIEDATVLKNDAGLTLQIRFKGGATRTLSLPAPKTAWEERQTKAEVMAEIDRLLNDHTFREIAGILNERRLVSGTGRPFHGDRVEYLCRFYELKPRFDRLRAAGLLTLDELAVKLGRSKGTIKLWRLRGTLPVRAHKLDDNGRHMYEDPAVAVHEGLVDVAGSNEVHHDR